jgi:hypothetical protein
VKVIDQEIPRSQPPRDLGHPPFLDGRERDATGSSGVQRTMQMRLMCVLCSMAFLLQGCRKVTEQSFSEVRNGNFKVMIRSQEFNNSGSKNIDICVANISAHGFPDKRVQCFLNGYDFDGLAVRWQGPQVIQVSFRSGRVSRFTNSAFVYPGGPVPEEFHVVLCDGCETASAIGRGGSAEY